MQRPRALICLGRGCAEHFRKAGRGWGSLLRSLWCRRAGWGAGAPHTPASWAGKDAHLFSMACKNSSKVRKGVPSPQMPRRLM